MSSRKNTIAELSTAVFDNGRRGNPKPGCDCVQCFGYCMIDGDEALRQKMAGDRSPVDDPFLEPRA